ncbi:MAG TPA: hypothetical protein VGE72_23995 [Azospirillum sp.]
MGGSAWAIPFFIILLLAVVVFRQMYVGAINTKGLLSERTGAAYSFARLQLMLTTFFVAGVVFMDMTSGSGWAGRHSSLIETLALLFGGSNLGVLANKTWLPFRRP